MPLRRDKRRYGRTAKDVRRGGLGTHSTYSPPTIRTFNTWLRVNGMDIANTKSTEEFDDVTNNRIISFSHIAELNAGDYIELMFEVDDAAVTLQAIAAEGVTPSGASVTLSVTQVR